MLGQAHAEHDGDVAAIACLERAVLDDPYHLDALLALGVSHVNELEPSQALSSLKAWVEHNPKYHGLEVEADGYSDGSLMDDVLQLMQRAAAHSQDGDPDVQVVKKQAKPYISVCVLCVQAVRIDPNREGFDQVAGYEKEVPGVPQGKAKRRRLTMEHDRRCTEDTAGLYFFVVGAVSHAARPLQVTTFF